MTDAVRLDAAEADWAGAPAALKSPVPSEARRRRIAGPAIEAQRLFDMALTLVAVVVLAPLMFVIGLVVWLSDGGPVLFGQTRVGRHGRTFTCWKFRSMVTDSDARLRAHLASSEAARLEWALDHKLRRDPRITPFGRFLRASSLDELPQLWNVLVGEMSLVGPRPIVPAEIIRYSYNFPDYCSCRPGLTGLWQISGRNDVSYDRRVALDVEYVQRRSVGLYLVIVARTVPSVLMRRGCY